MANKKSGGKIKNWSKLGDRDAWKHVSGAVVYVSITFSKKRLKNVYLVKYSKRGKWVRLSPIAHSSRERARVYACDWMKRHPHGLGKRRVSYG